MNRCLAAALLLAACGQDSSPKDTKDMMGYCYPRWVSDYHYAKLAEHVVAARSFTGFE